MAVRVFSIIRDNVTMALEDDGSLETGKFTYELTEREELLLQGVDPDELPVDEAAEEEAAEEATENAVDVDDDDPVGSSAEDDSEEKDDLPEHWANASDRKLAEAYGLNDDDIEQIASREEFVRTLSAVSRVQSKAKPEPEQEEKAEEVVEDDASSPTDAQGRVNPAYYKANDYDDGYVKAIEALRKQQDEFAALTNQHKAQEAQQKQAEYARFTNDFHDAADDLRPEFYGKSLADGKPVKLSKQHAERREQLFDAVEQVAQYYAHRSTPIPDWKELVKRAERLAFGEELAKQEKSANLEAVKKQSLRRRPVANTAGAKASRKAVESDDPTVIASDPDVVAAWEKYSIQ